MRLLCAQWTTKGEGGNRKTGSGAVAGVQVRQEEGLILSSNSGNGQKGGIPEHSGGPDRTC